jgi:hypothetical protein
MKTRYLLLSVVILMVILAGWYIVKEKSTEEISNKDVVPSVLTVAPEGNFSYECQAGKSAFDVLDEKAEVEYDESSFGKLVTSLEIKK